VRERKERACACVGCGSDDGRPNVRTCTNEKKTAKEQEAHYVIQKGRREREKKQLKTTCVRRSPHCTRKTRDNHRCPHHRQMPNECEEGRKTQRAKTRRDKSGSDE